MNYAICWNCSYPDWITLNVSGILISRSSKNIYSEAKSAGNQRHSNINKALQAQQINPLMGYQARYESSLVGTSETTRVAPYSTSFCEWLAGLIDGDGCLLVNKQGYTSLEITMGLEDLFCLHYIQDKLGGSIKMRSGAKAWRYRLHNKQSMINLIHCINGNIRHSTRLLQLHRVCQVLSIPVILPYKITNENSWFSGFFDADGTITMRIHNKNKSPLLSIRVVNKLLQDVQVFKDHFGGCIFFDSSQNGYYHWSVQSRSDVLMMIDYFKKHTVRSHKAKRCHLIKDYFALYDLKAYHSKSIHNKAWLDFMNK